MTVAALVFCVVFSGHVTVFAGDPVTISRETTFITEPRTSDGKRIDYLKAFEERAYPQGWNTEQNGYRLIAEKLGVDAMNEGGVGGNKTEEQQQLFVKNMYEKLGISSPSKKAEKFVEADTLLYKLWNAKKLLNKLQFWKNEKVDDWKDDWKKYSEFTGRIYHPWTLETVPELKSWLKEVEPTLQIVKEAAEKPVFFIPAVSWKEHGTFSECGIATEMQRLRVFARTLAVRANYRLGTGDIDGAIDDILTLRKLGSHLYHQQRVIPLLLGLAFFSISDPIGPEANLQRPASREQLQRLLETLQKRPHQVDVTPCYEHERYFGLDLLQRIAWGEDLKTVIDPFFFAFLSSRSTAVQKLREDRYSLIYRLVAEMTDWNRVLKRYNECCDKESDLKEFQIIEDTSKLSEEERSDYFADLTMKSVLGPFYRNALEEAIHRYECTDHLRQIALAMLIYSKDHGTLPPTFTVDKNGKPLQCWRVLLLPYLGEEAKMLGQKIRLDEPWDSEYNRQFHDALLSVYQCPSYQNLKPGETTYSVVIGEKTDDPFAVSPSSLTPFDRSGKGRKLSDFGEKSRDMILVLETKKPVCWMNPNTEVTLAQIENHNKDEHQLINREWLKENIYSSHTGGFNAALRSGAVEFISDTINDETFLGQLQGTAESQ
ncbi:MAG: DUF1559 domain-containing protein [Planctomycetaceae bacterium]|nr:DUF1559 domain-containing protein [Planctomycetaceae bacterium]